MAETNFGPVEFVVIGLPEAGVPADVTAEIRRLVESDVVDLLDVAYVSASENGEYTSKEIEELTDYPELTELGLDVPGLIGADDLDEVIAGLVPGQAALVLVVEHTWARRFVTTVAASGGQVLASERISAEVVNEIIEFSASDD